jgi:hypothetical protein
MVPLHHVRDGSIVVRMFDEVMLLEASTKAAGADASLASDDELFEAVSAVERARALLDATRVASAGRDRCPGGQ